MLNYNINYYTKIISKSDDDDVLYIDFSKIPKKVQFLIENISSKLFI